MDQANPPLLRTLKIACSNCNLFELCLPMGLDNQDLDRLEQIIKRKKPLQRGDSVFRIGDPLHSIYALRAGSVKTFTFTEDGSEQITGFHLSGELLGFDAISTDRHTCSAKALETTQVCEIPFHRLEELGREVPGLAHQFLRLMSQELVQDQALLVQLSKKSAEERIAAFLLNLSLRYRQRGFSPSEFNLSMSRTDIGNYLGLAIETVSRLFGRLQDEGLIQVDRKHIVLTDLDRMAELAGHGPESRQQCAS